MPEETPEHEYRSEVVLGLCSVVDCENPGTWQPILGLRSSPLQSNSFACTFTGITACESHKLQTNAAGFLTDFIWSTILNEFRRAASEQKVPLRPPVRDLTTLTWEPVQQVEE